MVSPSEIQAEERKPSDQVRAPNEAVVDVGDSVLLE